jgi:hypothetical protein
MDSRSTQKLMSYESANMKVLILDKKARQAQKG